MLAPFQTLETVNGFMGDTVSMAFTTTALAVNDRTNPTFIESRRGFRVYSSCTEAVTPVLAPITLTINNANLNQAVDNPDQCVFVQSQNYPNNFPETADDFTASVEFSSSVLAACTMLNLQFEDPFDIPGTTCMGQTDERVVLTNAQTDGTIISQVNGGSGRFCGQDVPNIPDEPIPPVLRVKFVRNTVQGAGKGFKLRICPTNCQNRT